SLNIVLIFEEDNEFLSPTDLGPESWQIGSAVRIQRLRNGSEIELEDVIRTHEGVLYRFGGLSAGSSQGVDQIEGLKYDFLDIDPTWQGSVIVFVKGDHTYFIESMCMRNMTTVCNSIDSIVDSIHLDAS
ncbi:hypothetical protein JYU04_03865, partial [Dehalococcoides mccartyi]|nr:hypothetical protein [Dehalococcoides mccartyi]